jgi:hypothetical protein
METVFCTVVRYKRDEVKNEFSWNGANIQKGSEPGSRGIVIVKAVTRK